MTVKPDLTPEVEAGLAAQAHARGLTLEAYLDQVLQSAIASKSHERGVLPTQAEAIERARELNPNVAPLVERVRNTDEGSRDKWRKP